jgi:hypothetical protein
MGAIKFFTNAGIVSSFDAVERTPFQRVTVFPEKANILLQLLVILDCCL